MTERRRLPTQVHKLIGRKWDGDADRVVEEKLRQLQDMGLGLPKLPITTKGDILIYTSGYDRFPAGEDGTFLQSDSTTQEGVAWVEIDALASDDENNIIANMVFGA
jgi:hypothetical protein